MPEDWPSLGPVLLAVLPRTFRTPLCLQAAFDTDAECESLLQSLFPDMIDEEVLNTVAVIMTWQTTGAPALQRLRICTVSQGFFRLPPVRSSDIQSSYQSITQSNAITVLELATKKKQRKYKDEPPDARAQKFESDRRKYSLLLANVIKLARLPVVELINTLDDPASAWIHLFAARRANTLKNRYKSWRPFANWLELHHAVHFPTSCNVVINYMQSRVDDGCGKTVPEAFSIVLNMLEVLGRVPEDQQISRDPIWVGHIKSWTAEMSACSVCSGCHSVGASIGN